MRPFIDFSSGVPTFQGKGKDCSGNNKDLRSQDASGALTQKLLEQGYNQDYFRREWGVTLWSIRDKKDGLKVKVDGPSSVDMQELGRFLSQVLGLPIRKIENKPVSSCCHSPCKGCLVGNPAERRNWIG